MKSLSLKTLLAALALSAIATSAPAHEGMHGPGSDFDADGNGTLSLAEYTAYLKNAKQDIAGAAASFAAIDSNKDGAISSGEFARSQKATKQK